MERSRPGAKRAERAGLADGAERRAREDLGARRGAARPALLIVIGPREGQASFMGYHKSSQSPTLQGREGAVPRLFRA